MPFEKIVESETVELKRSTSELKEAVIAIVAMLNKHGRGELYFGFRNDGMPLGQQVSENTLREISRTISESIEPKNILRLKLWSCQITLASKLNLKAVIGHILLKAGHISV